jgi:hypothetical protein
MRAPLRLIAPLLLLSACDSTPPAPLPIIPQPQGGASVAGTGTLAVWYACTNNTENTGRADKAKVQTTYGRSGANVPNLFLTVRGKTLEMTGTSDAAGTRYTLDGGLQPGQVVIWHARSTGDALLQTTPSPAATAASPVASPVTTPVTTLATCKPTSPPVG